MSRRKFERELAVMMGEASAFVAGRSWELLGKEYPDLKIVFRHPRSGRRVGFWFSCENWDEEPPSLALFDPETGETLAWQRWPQSGWAAGNPHPTTGRPFLCLPGIREYHIHSSHLNDPWSNYRSRDSYQLRYIVDRVRQRFEVTNG